MTGFGRVVGCAVAVASALGVNWASQVSVPSRSTDQALLRLAWRARPERLERCVTQSPDTLASLPPHMRQATICEGISASYRLQVWRDGILLADDIVAPGGLRRDRPLYVLRDLPMPVRDVTVRVTFTRVESDLPANYVKDGGATMREAVPAHLAWDQQLAFAPGQVRVVTYDPSQQTLVQVSGE